MAERKRRRFVPDHIETTFDSVRQPKPKMDLSVAATTPTNPNMHGPRPEPTPEPTPRSLTPEHFAVMPSRDGAAAPRRFHPQLIESQRRVRRVGDVGPATRPGDKTDVTPYTNHMYKSRSKSRLRLAPAEPMSRRESMDEEAGQYLLELAAREADRQMREAALAAFPNSGRRQGGVSHFYFEEHSGDDTSDGTVSTQPPTPSHVFAPRHRLRRKSTHQNLGLNWWHKYMQEHAEKIAKKRRDEDRPVVVGIDDLSDSELDNMELPMPEDALWLTHKRKSTHMSRSSFPGPMGPIGETFMPLIQADPYITSQHKPYAGPSRPPPARATGETTMPSVPSAAIAPSAELSRPPRSNKHVPAETGFRRQPREERHSPPLLGDSLEFRKCPSPKQTKLEPDHLFSKVNELEEKGRDHSEKTGLWHGYCVRTGSDDADIVPPALHGPKMMSTPKAESRGGSGDPFAREFAIRSVATGSDTSLSSGPSSSGPSTTAMTPEHRLRTGEAKGLHMLAGLDERLRREKAAADVEDKIASEFDEAFVTQVYNYLSLGYPATARAFDDELSKITGVAVQELRKDDGPLMARGHYVETRVSDVPDDKRCPRWKALRVYIAEWARQHPNLDSLDPLAWGVRERRGSWAV